MEVRSGYKQTEVGVIPEDWEIEPLGALTDPKRPISYGIVQTGPSVPNGVRCLRVLDVDDGRINKSDLITTTKTISDAYKRTVLRTGDFVMPLRGKVGDVALVDEDLTGCNLTRGLALIAIRSEYSVSFCKQFISAIATRGRLEQSMNGSALQEIPIATLRTFRIALPPTKAEQEAIAETLSDADALIESLEQLLTKKRDIKQGAMQELLTGKKRLPGFRGEWQVNCIAEIADCLDNLRVPLNDAQRTKMKGDYPYCGANGLLDYIDRYCVDDSVILMAEDGGYFDEYMTRPIAYQMSGKFWVNNHAHILKSKPAFDQTFLFYSLVHKNILSFLASGTRAKLNKSELNKITIWQPADKTEQSAIASILSDMDTEIAALEARLAKTRDLKQGMMQELLTGRIRLV